MRINDLIKHTSVRLIDRRLSRTRELTPTASADGCDGRLLFAYKRVGGGYNTFPHELRAKPYAVVCEPDYAKEVRDTPLIIVDDPRAALAHALYLHNEVDKCGLKLIAVTGTNGKTTTATLLSSILNHAGIPCGRIGTGAIYSRETRLSDADYTMTTPDPELLYPSLKRMAEDGCAAAVIEASSHSIALRKLAPLTFERGIFTNLSHEHGDFHPTMEDYYLAKESLFKSCRGGIFNIDDEYSERAYNARLTESTSVGIVNRGEVYATDIEPLGELGSRFNYRQEGLISRVEIGLPGAFNIYNATMAMCCAIELGVSPKDAKDGLASVNTVDGRMEKIHSEPIVIIDYAHTPQAMENALKTLKKRLKPRQRLISVFGCGGNRDKSKRPMMARASERYADLTVLTSDNSRDEDADIILRDAEAGFAAPESYVLVPDRKEAIEYALTSADRGDIVAILGKGHERYIIDGGGKRHFDEREIVKHFYSERRGEVKRE